MKKIAEELLQTLYEKMWFRGPLPEEGWAIEKICAALNAARLNAAPTPAIPPQNIVAQWVVQHLGESITYQETYLSLIGLLEQLGIINPPRR